MVKVIISHEVKNFADWKKGFEAGEPMRTQAGVKINGVYTSVDNANHVTITSEFPNMEAVQGFLGSPNMQADMEKAGVIGSPEVKILTPVH